MLCSAITWSRFPHVIQRPKLLEVSVRGRENVAETANEFRSSASPVAWHVCSWCYILQLTWCPWLKQILHKVLLHKLLRKNLFFTWTQLWVRWHTYSRYFQIVCYNNQAVSKFQVMNFLYITLLTQGFEMASGFLENLWTLWRYRYVFPNTHANAQLYVLTTLIPHIATLVCPSSLLAATLKTRHTLTHFSSCHFLSLLLSVFIKTAVPGR